MKGRCAIILVMICAVLPRAGEEHCCIQNAALNRIHNYLNARGKPSTMVPARRPVEMAAVAIIRSPSKHTEKTTSMRTINGETFGRRVTPNGQQSMCKQQIGSVDGQPDPQVETWNST